MNPFLTILLIDNAEIDPSYLDLYFGALREWNLEAIKDTQIIAISQKKVVNDLQAVCAGQPYPVEIVHAEHEFVGNYPIWDILASARQVWPAVRGRYVTFHHPEFIWGRNRLRKTLTWLADNAPYFAMGNLRRPGSHREILQQKAYNACVRSYSDQLKTLMNGGRGFNENHTRPNAIKLFEAMPTCWWVYWAPEQKPGPAPYIEDLFFADRDWLDSWAFTEHGGELPFQDVFDLIGAAMTKLAVKNLAPRCQRMPQDVNRIMHLWHPKAWYSWTPEIRDWFFSQPERWAGTKFLDAAVWERVITYQKTMPKSGAPITPLRSAPGGTVTRYAAALNQWLFSGGYDRVSEFYSQHGRDKHIA